MLMCELFQEVADEVCEKMEFEYDKKEADNSLGYLKHVRELPEDASGVY